MSPVKLKSTALKGTAFASPPALVEGFLMAEMKPSSTPGTPVHILPNELQRVVCAAMISGCAPSSRRWPLSSRLSLCVPDLELDDQSTQNCLRSVISAILNWPVKVPEAPVEAAATPENSERTPVYSTTVENDAREGPDERVVCATFWSKPRVTYHRRDTDRHRDAVEVQADVALAPFGGPAMPCQYSSRFHHLFVRPRRYAARGRRSEIRRFANGR